MPTPRRLAKPKPVKLDDQQAARALDARAKKYLGMTGRQFLAAAKGGTFFAV